MLIGIHAKALSEKHPTGVGLYTRHLLQHLINLPEAGTHRFLLYVDEKVSLRGAVATKQSRRQVEKIPRSPQLARDDEKLEYRILRSPMLWTQARLGWELFMRKPDAFFSPHHVLPKTAPKNSVVTIHGLEFERFPQYYAWHEREYLRWVTKDAVKRAARVIAVSQATKRDLMEFYNVSEERIAVVYHGVTNDLYDQRPLRPTTGSVVGRESSVVSPYFLYIGRVEKKKNVDGIIRAFTIAKERYKLPHRLVLAGGDGYGAQEIKNQKLKIKNSEQVKFLGYISEGEKWQLLRGAEALVFPSWYEGFGLPILEAQSMGVPVITSNISAMPEVAGGGALLVDPGDTESIAQAMRRIAEDETLRAALIAEGYENVKRFSWERCAKATFHFYRIG